MNLPIGAERIIKSASKSPTKGNYRVYNLYRQELSAMALSPADYEKAVKRLAKVLKV